VSNNLKNETSLHLKECANTPIHWFPYSTDALYQAKVQKRPIFLSIGYHGSYWCGVMREESFLNPTIAKLLNDHFICIKVDKDERPDIDKYYKQVYRLMNGQDCASPLSVFLTEDQAPFYTAAYIAPTPRGNVLGFEELLQVVIEKYQHDKTTMVEKGQEILDYLTPQHQTRQATRLNLNIQQTITRHAQELMDKREGGFGKDPKFLNISTLDLLLETYHLNHDSTLRSLLTLTVNKMLEGDIYDTQIGGFYRYANTQTWQFPRLEKMLYDNANMVNFLLDFYQVTGERQHHNAAIKSLDFLLNRLHNGKLFFSHLFEGEKSQCHIDTKIVTSFNAMAINALFYAATFEPKYLEVATTTLEQLLREHYPEKRLYHTHNIHAFLEDYAYLGEALLRAYTTTKNPRYLMLAEEILNQAIELFYDHGAWRFSKTLPQLYDDAYDPLYPSAISTVIFALHQLSSLIESDYHPLVFKTLEYHSYHLMRQPLSRPKMSKVLLRHLKKMI